MLRYARFPTMRLYAVEISGWDSAQDFFVEKCDLVWYEDSGKHVALKQTLRENAKWAAPIPPEYSGTTSEKTRRPGSLARGLWQVAAWLGIGQLECRVPHRNGKVNQNEMV